jgi:hypothetical protein
MRLHSRTGSVRGQRAGGVPGGWNGKCLDAEVSGHAHRNTHSARFEGSSRVLRFIFDPDFPEADFFAKTTRWQEWSPPFTQSHWFFVER